MQAVRPDISSSANRPTIVAGLLLSLCLPIFWFTVLTQPDPMNHQTDPNRIVWLYPLAVSISQTGLLVPLAGVSGVFLTAFQLFKRSQRMLHLFVFVVALILALTPMVRGLFTDDLVFRHSDSITAHGKYYHLLEAKYPDGPSYEIVLACDALGVRCEQLLVAGGLSGKHIDFPAFVSQLPQP